MVIHLSNQKILAELLGKLWGVFRALLLLGMSFLLLYPVIYMVSVSIREPLDLLDPGVIWIPKGFTLRNFAESFAAMDYIKAFGRSLYISGVSSLLQIMVCALIAYGFARFKFREKNFMFALVILTIIVPTQITILPIYLMFQNFSIPFVGPFLEKALNISLSVNLLDNPAVFYIQALLGFGIRSGLYIFLLREFFKGLPKELEDAAFIDGCGAFKTFVKIILPISTTMLITVFLFSIVWYWNDYFNTSMFLTDKQTLAIALTKLRAALALKTGNLSNIFDSITQMQAGCLLFMLPLLVLFLFAQRFFTQGIERSGIVG